MRKETKLIKNILQSKYPNKTFSIRFKTATQYYDTSDKIIITIPKDMYNDIRQLLSNNVKNIKITKFGELVSISGFSTPLIYDIKNNVWVDADMLEFIEIKTAI